MVEKEKEKKEELAPPGLLGSKVSLDMIKKRLSDLDALKKLILRDQDYIWFIRKGTQKPEACISKEDAEKKLARYKKANITAVLDRKVKKSGCYRIKEIMQRIEGVDYYFKKIEQRDNLEAWEKGEAKNLTFTMEIGLMRRNPDGEEELVEFEKASCSTRERSFAHLPHDVETTCLTRAKCRNILNYWDFGELSAEELSYEGGTREIPIIPLEGEKKPEEKPKITKPPLTPKKEETAKVEEAKLTPEDLESMKTRVLKIKGVLEQPGIFKHEPLTQKERLDWFKEKVGFEIEELRNRSDWSEKLKEVEDYLRGLLAHKDKMRKTYFAVANELGKSSEDAKAWAKKQRGVESFTHLTGEEIGKLVDEMRGSEVSL